MTLGESSDVEVDIKVKAKEDLDELINLLKATGGQIVTVAEDYVKVILRRNTVAHLQDHPKVASVSETSASTPTSPPPVIHKKKSEETPDFY